MSDLTPEIAERIAAACQANAADAASTLGTTLGAGLTLSVGEAAPFDPASAEAGPGLVVLLTFGSTALAGVLSQASGLVPEWCQAPDATGQSKLSTLAQELSMQLVPDDLMADTFQAAWVDDVAAALGRGMIGEGAVVLSLELKTEVQSAPFPLIWPLAAPGQVFQMVQHEGREGQNEVAHSSKMASNISELPLYTRSLLKISVPVRVVLATKKESVQDVVELASGTIIKFSKPCDDSLALYVGDQQVAEGEAVKVGDKFGFRVTAMSMPQEHFLKIRTNRAG